jgi:hypothetical protein
MTFFGICVPYLEVRYINCIYSIMYLT